MASIVVTDLDSDVLIDIFLQLSVKDVLRVRQTCRYLCSLTRVKNIWLKILREEVLATGLALPAYSRSLEDLADSQLEAFVKHFHCMEQDIRRRLGSRPLHVVSLRPPSSVTWVKFVRADWVVVATCDANSSKLSIWSLPSLLSSRESVLSQIDLPGPVQGGVLEINDNLDDADDRIIVALDICSPRASILVFQLFDDHGSVPRFSLLATLDDASQLRALRGSTICFALHQELSVPCMWNWETKVVTRLSDQPHPLGGCIAMDVWDNFVAVIAPEELRLYTVSRDDHASTAVRTLLHFRGEVSHADVRFTTEPSTGAPLLHLCICDYLGLHVLLLQDLTIANQDFYAVRRWSSPLPLCARPELMPYEVAPRLSIDGTSMSWINAYEPGCGPFTLAFSRLPPSRVALPAELQPRTPGDAPHFTLRLDDGPALYYYAVRDMDEALGLFVVGNAFGELAVVRYGGVPLRELKGCFRETRLPVLSDLPSEAVVHHFPAPPFPHSAVPPLPNTSTADTLAPCLRPNIPEELPEAGWLRWPDSPDGLSPSLAALWHDLLWRQAPRLRTKHYFGTPRPLLLDGTRTRVVISVGGVRFVWFRRPGASAPPSPTERAPASPAERAAAEGEVDADPDDTPDVFMRLPQGLTLRAIAAWLDVSDTPFPDELLSAPVYAVPVRALYAHEARSGRDRWAEVQAS